MQMSVVSSTRPRKIVNVVLSPWFAGEYGKVKECDEVVSKAWVVLRLGRTGAPPADGSDPCVFSHRFVAREAYAVKFWIDCQHIRAVFPEDTPREGLKGSRRAN